jgi:hypothetical protein
VVPFGGIFIVEELAGAQIGVGFVCFGADPAAKTKAAPNATAAALAELLPRADFPLQMNLVPQFSEDGSAEVRVPQWRRRACSTVLWSCG